MALKATIFKVHLNISDVDRHYYHAHQLTIAQHPSETDERMMVRLVAFILNASENLSFSRGLSSDDEPELADRSLSDEIELWVAFGQPDEKWLRKASGRAKRVYLYCYGGRSVPIWWQQNQSALARYQNLSIWNIEEQQVKAITALVSRNMDLQASIADGQMWLSDESESIMLELEPLLLATR